MARGNGAWLTVFLALYILLSGGNLVSGLAFWPLAVFIHTFAADPRVHTFGESNVLSFLG